LQKLKAKIEGLKEEIEDLKAEAAEEKSWSVDITNDGTLIVSHDGQECPAWLLSPFIERIRDDQRGNLLTMTAVALQAHAAIPDFMN
jgi:hypothetical protein